MRKPFKAFVSSMIVFGATAMQISGCGLGRLIAGVNPCGSLLDCDPRAYAFVQSGIDGAGVEVDEDPFCTYAPFCSEDVDPIYGGLVAP